MSSPNPDVHPASATPSPAPAPSPIHSDEAFARFFRESFETTIAWTLSHLPFIARDRLTAEQIAGDGYDATYARRHQVRSNPVAFLHDRIRECAQAYKRRPNTVALDRPSLQTPLDPAGRAPDSLLASQECREIFGEEALGTLDPDQRRLYDLYLEGKDYREIAQILGRNLAQVKSSFKVMFRQLCEAMARHITIDRRDIPRGKHVGLRNRKSALAAIGTLPLLLRKIATLAYVEGLSPVQIVVRLKLASQEEFNLQLDRAHEVLEILYREPMPRALIRALADDPPESPPPGGARVP